MKKIPTLFVRDPHDRRRVLDEVTPGCEWVIAGEGVATRKYDGTCVMLDDAGQWWARREVKPGKDAPNGWKHVSTDEVTGKSVGWEPMHQSSFAPFLDEALRPNAFDSEPVDLQAGTYELVGPKINGNPEALNFHHLTPHGRVVLQPPHGVSFDGLRAWLTDPEFRAEGIVWHHPDGRMAKLKKRDFPTSEEPNHVA